MALSAFNPRSLMGSPRFARLIIGVFAVGLVLAILTPVYSDEIGWRLQERGWLDGVDKLYSEQCGPSTLARPLWFMWPVRWYSAFFNTGFPDPFWVRFSGVLYALAWAGLLLALIRRMAAGAAQNRAVAVLMLGLLGLGTLPLQLVWSRPEQPILLAALGAMLVAWNGRERLSWWRPAAITLLAGIALSYHFKALVLVPLFLACIAPQRSPALWRLLCAAALLGLTAASAQYWFARLSCPADAMLAAQHAGQSLHYEGSLVKLALRALANDNLPAYVTLAAPDVTPMSHWLPYHLVTKPEQIAWSAAMIGLWFIAFLLAGGALWRAVRRGGIKAALDLRVVFALLLFGIASAYASVQMVRNCYEAAFVLPLLAMSFACALCAEPNGGPRLPTMAAITGLAMLLSMVMVGAIYGPSLIRAAQASGYLAEQPLSVPVFHYDRARATIRKAAALCGIDPANHQQRLLIDDATYFTFMQSRLPDHHLSVLDPQWRGAVTDPLSYLKSQGMDGAVVHCRFLDPATRRHARAADGVCCLSRAMF